MNLFFLCTYTKPPSSNIVAGPSPRRNLLTNIGIWNTQTRDFKTLFRFDRGTGIIYFWWDTAERSRDTLHATFLWPKSYTPWDIMLCKQWDTLPISRCWSSSSNCDVMIFCLALPLASTLMMWMLHQFTMGFHAFFYPVISNDCQLKSPREWKNWHETWTWPFSRKRTSTPKLHFWASITFSFGERCIWISTLNLSFHWWVHGGTVPLVFCGSTVPGGGGWNLWWKTLCPLQMEGGPQKN